MEIALDVESATKGARDITLRTCDNAPFTLLQTRHPQFMLFQTRHPQWLTILTLLHPPTLDSFYLDTVHDAQNSTFWITDVRVNNISVTFKVDIRRYRGNGSLRKYPTDFGSAGGQLEVIMPDKKLCGPNGIPLDLRGRLTVALSQK